MIEKLDILNGVGYFLQALFGLLLGYKCIIAKGKLINLVGASYMTVSLKNFYVTIYISVRAIDYPLYEALSSPTHVLIMNMVALSGLIPITYYFVIKSEIPKK